MKYRQIKSGFTLVEILVASALVVTIVSIVYGSWFATSRTASAYRNKMALSVRTQAVLEQMTRQLRCAYVPQSPIAEAIDTGPTRAEKFQAIVTQATGREKPSRYFYGGVDKRKGGFLRFLTTYAAVAGQQFDDRLFEVRYEFDRATNRLCFGRRRFVPTADNGELAAEHVLLNAVESLGVEFYDGRTWLGCWDFAEQHRLPAAVKIELTCQDERGGFKCRSAVVYLWCGQRPNRQVHVRP